MTKNLCQLISHSRYGKKYISALYEILGINHELHQMMFSDDLIFEYLEKRYTVLNLTLSQLREIIIDL